MSTIAVIGAGYVGLVTGTCLAQEGHSVIIIENNQEKIRTLLQAQIPFYEPGLDTIVAQTIRAKTLTFEKSIQKGLERHPEIIFSCVGTPSLPNGDADLSYVEQAAAEIGTYLENNALIVNKSTVPVGTTKKIAAIIQSHLTRRATQHSIEVASNPEFLKEGNAVNDFCFPDRIIVGVESEHAAQTLYELYKPFLDRDNQFICMNPESAELTKYAANTMLAMRISFMNQLALLADRVSADIECVRQGIGSDPRIGTSFLYPGIGYGGSCFPKDVTALVSMGKEHHFPMTIAQEIDNINHFQRVWFLNRIIAHYGPALTNKTVGIWGLAFKPETDDIRCAPAVEIIDELLTKKTRILAYDPAAGNNIKKLYGSLITLVSTPQEILNTADFLIILTEWKEFLNFKPQDFCNLRDKTVFDGRNCFDPHAMHASATRQGL